MARDHFVSQVHLKQFGDGSKGGRVNVVRKSDLLRFAPWPKDICRVEDGNTNPFLLEPRAVEEFLKAVEPAYERCLENVRREVIGRDERAVFAGFFAFIGAYTPTAMRIMEPLLRKQVEVMTRAFDQQGELMPFPDVGVTAFSGKTVSQLMDEGLISVSVDKRMPQAMATQNLLRTLDVFSKSDWTVIHADTASSLFFTSDHPSSILAFQAEKYAQRVFPLAPDLAIVVHTETGQEKRDRIRNKFVDPRKQTVRRVNSLTAQGAEDLVIFAKDEPWVFPFIEKNKGYRAEMHDHSAGPFLLFREGVTKNP